MLHFIRVLLIAILIIHFNGISEHENIYLPLDDDDIDAYLYAYLRACKYYVNSAFERVCTYMYYTYTSCSLVPFPLGFKIRGVIARE